MSNILAELEPECLARTVKALELMRADDRLKALGVASIVIVETRRALATQMAYYSRGRMKKPEYVRAMYEAAGLYQPTDKECDTPNTWTLKSKHIEGRAVDLAPSRDGKSIWWNAPLPVWRPMGEIGKSAGLVWGGDWDTVDLPHFEV